MTTHLTAEEKQARLNEIARSVSDEVIQLTGKRQLETWCKGLFPISTLRKQELADKLVETLAGTRKAIEDEARSEELRLANERLEAELIEREKAIEEVEYSQILASAKEPDAIERRIIARQQFGFEAVEAEQRALILYKELKRITITSNTLENLRSALNKLAINHVLQERAAYAPSTIKSRKSGIIKLMKRALDEESPKVKPDVSDSFTIFVKLYTDLIEPIVKAVKKAYTEEVTDTNKSLTLLDPNPILEYAEKSLKILGNWKDVSIALIIVTGRRMAEIHGTATFEILAPDKILFDGQLKTRGTREVLPYEIPTLVDSSLVVAGIDYLAKQGKRYEATSELSISDIVNKKVSNPLSYHIKERGKKWGTQIPFMYKDMRALYAEICYRQMGETLLMTTDAYYGLILGHGETDTVTAKSYAKYRLVNCPCPKKWLVDGDMTQTGQISDNSKTEVGHFSEG